MAVNFLLMLNPYGIFLKDEVVKSVSSCQAEPDEGLRINSVEAD